MSSDRSGSISLNKKQIEFLVKMTEIKDVNEAVEHFAFLLVQERADPSKMSKYIDKIMEKNRNV